MREIAGQAQEGQIVLGHQFAAAYRLIPASGE